MGFPVPVRKSTVAALLTAWWISAPASVAAQDAAVREADLLRQLREAETPYAAGLVAAELRGLWSRSGSPSIDLLVKRGQDALEAGDAPAAIEHFTAAIDHGPGFAGAYAGRAAALYVTGRVGPAIDDLRQALVLNPNDFESLTGFAVILEELGRPEDALEVWRRVADMNPQDDAAAQAAERLELLTEGQAL
jgi:tetratricopeptide (TPR) repeat protein